ncbi:MAG TPA: hypothetical protein VHQ43_02330 [Solirubrobacterales bacterium]|jgi:hypothetical protein|nr:hypothetical protein [Solirubrobacterales bacterium]
MQISVCGLTASDRSRWKQGGLTIATNLVAAWEQCNRSKGGRTPAEWEIAKRR